ncbi:MAG TPA: sigma factor, partial [Acidimicrobiales bacterium]|nr:sigma factor [Acidimicrobiales bacterium]
MEGRGGEVSHSERLLIEQHVALARHLAGRFADRGEMLDDLVQVAFLGLVKAAKRFDDTRGVQFST